MAIEGLSLLDEQDKKYLSVFLSDEFQSSPFSVPVLWSFADRFLKPKRLVHVQGCTKTVLSLADKFQADSVCLERAAILHDCTKALSINGQLILAEKYGILLSSDDIESPEVIHAITGAGVAEYFFHESPAVCNAVRNHTTGSEIMTLEDIILYVSDMIEPSRNFPGVESLRLLAEQDIYVAYYAALEQTVSYLKERKVPVHPRTLQALHKGAIV